MRWTAWRGCTASRWNWRAGGGGALGEIRSLPWTLIVIMPVVERRRSQRTAKSFEKVLLSKARSAAFGGQRPLTTKPFRNTRRPLRSTAFSDQQKTVSHYFFIITSGSPPPRAHAGSAAPRKRHRP